MDGLTQPVPAVVRCGGPLPAIEMASAAPSLPDIPAPTDLDKPRFLISDLCVDLEDYLPSENIREVYRAYLFSAEAHEGQTRKSGEPYIYHPVAVARILAEMRMDHKCLMAAILHDVIEDTHTAKETLARVFDEEIAELVDGVSKLTQIDFESRAEAQAANMRKMLLAMTKDIRVILIKLADRLHNMRTLGVMKPKKSRRISRETMDIYAPIANRLGINSIRLELEDLGFAHYWPWRYSCLSNAVNKTRGARKELVGNVETAIEERMRQDGLKGRVIGRQKHLYSIYRKMVQKKLSFKEVVDVYAFRIIVDSLDSCYRVLGCVHNLYKPVPGRFKDYIAIPKSNGYQSLHTVLFGPNGLPIEIQIRTEDMHRMAESGIAAHWVYKTQKGEVGGAQARASDWLQNLLEMQQGAGDSMEFLENVKIDLFPDEVYVFTPKGRILVLPRGATAVDFAYAIHSDVGGSCVAARIDRRLAPLRTTLYSGQTVEIITAPGARPNPAWLNFVVTGKARASIRSYLKQLQSREAEGLGRRLLDKELAHFGLNLEGLPPERLQDYLSSTGGVEDLAGLLRQIGLGNRLPRLVARNLAGEGSADQRCEHSTGASSLAIVGTEGMVVNYGKCCRPIPGDPITGLFSAGKGLVVHRQGCRNLGDFQRHGHNWLEVEWEEGAEVELPTEIRVDLGNQRGVLATVAAAIAEMGSNIENVRTQERDGMSSTIGFLINVRGRRHLAAIMRRLRALDPVLRIVRVSH
jgi:guanosine-3',5'-bis(diphosphate) 3'-pyrophosphohydrolase